MMKALEKRKLIVFLAIFAILFSIGGFCLQTNAAQETAPKGEIEVYLIAGQSNAVGYGENLTSTDERFVNGFDDVLYYGQHEYYPGEDGEALPTEFVPVKFGYGQKPYRAGAEIGIASALGGTGRKSAVIKCAWGATALYNSTNETSEKHGTWTPPTYIIDNGISTEGNKIGRLYNWFLETAKDGIDMLKADGYTPVIKGIWWMQGEAETGNATNAGAYEELLTDLINDMRSGLTELTGINQSSLPFVIGKITRKPGTTVPAYMDVVNKAQADVAATINNVFVVDTSDLEQQDAWHYTADSQKIIGERFVDVVLSVDGDVYTKYGVIPNDKVYAEDGVTKLPFALFKNEEYLDSYASWYEAFEDLNSTEYLRGKQTQDITLQLVLVDDYTATNDSNGVFYNTSHLGGKLIIDLNGNTITIGSKDHLLNGYGKSYLTSEDFWDTTIIFENGNIVAGENKKVLTTFGIITSSYPADKSFNYTFNNVNFSFKEGTEAAVLVAGSAGVSDNTDASKKLYVNMEFNNCVFDFTNRDASKLFSFAEYPFGEDENGDKIPGNIIQNVRINGGRIIKATCKSGALYTIGKNDTVTFGKYEGHYTELELPSGVKPASEDFTDADTNALGKLVFAKKGSESTGGEDDAVSKDIYELTCLVTKYGTIPAAYLAVETYPYVLFKFNGEALEEVTGYSKFLGVNTNDGAFHFAKVYLETNEWNEESGYKGQKSVVILQRRDYTTEKGEVYWNLAQMRGEATLDLNGYKLAQFNGEDGNQPIFRISSKTWGTNGMTDGHADVFPTTINVINGNIETFSHPVMLFQMTASSSNYAKIAEKIFTLNYRDVRFSLAPGSTTTSLMFGYYNNGTTTTADPNPMAPFFTNFNDCTIDINARDPQKNFLLFDIDPSNKRYICNTVTFNGGMIRTKEWNDYIILSNKGTSESTFTFGVSETTGKYASLSLPRSLTYPTQTMYEDAQGNKLTFTFVEYGEAMGRSIYTLGKCVKTEYGYLENRYSDPDEYPFILIVLDKDGSITQLQAYKMLLGSNNSGAVSYAKDFIKTNEWNSKTGYEGQLTAKIIFRRDYILGADERYDNFAQIRGEVTIDLDGYTLSQTATSKARQLFYISSKPWGTDGMADGHADVFPTTINIVNGRLLTYNNSIFRLSMNQTATSESIANKKFTINLDGVTMGLVEGATTSNLIFSYHTSSKDSSWSDEEMANAPYYFNITNCIIDLDTVKPSTAINLFNVSPNSEKDNYITNTVNVYGGEITAENLDNINFVTEAQNGSAITFNKISGGNYLSIALDKSAAIPSVELNDGELVFVKVSESTNEVIYRLRPIAVSNIDYSPKMSITLGNELVMNVYVPTNYTQEFTFNGIKYDTINNYGGNIATIDGNTYYHVTVALASSEAAKEMELAATVSVGESKATGTFTFSIPKYAKRILGDANSTEVEKTLIKDVLAYIRAAYVYFDAEDKAEATNVIDEILGDYNCTFAKTEGATNTENGLWGVVIVLDAKPSIRFVLPEGVTADNYTFKSGNTTLAYTTGTMTIEDKTHNYAEVSLYAYQLIKEITYSDGTNSGSYHINSYYDFVTTNEELKNDTNFIALVEKLYNYCKSAETYRASVTSK